MARHPQAQGVLDVMAALGDPPLHEDTPLEARARRHARIRPSTEAIHERRDVDAGGVSARLNRSSARGGLGLVVYLHGGQGTPDDPRVSPLRAEETALRGAPPAMIVTAEYDPLRDEGRAYAELLRAAGVEVATVHNESMMHGFVSLADLVDDGRGALAEAGDALTAALA